MATNVPLGLMLGQPRNDYDLMRAFVGSYSGRRDARADTVDAPISTVHSPLSNQDWSMGAAQDYHREPHRAPQREAVRGRADVSDRHPVPAYHLAVEHERRRVGQQHLHQPPPGRPRGPSNRAQASRPTKGLSRATAKPSPASCAESVLSMSCP